MKGEHSPDAPRKYAMFAIAPYHLELHLAKSSDPTRGFTSTASDLGGFEVE
jgi:hypothetical protein